MLLFTPPSFSPSTLYREATAPLVCPVVRQEYTSAAKGREPGTRRRLSV
jgi:hypothetical protein